MKRNQVMTLLALVLLFLIYYIHIIHTALGLHYLCLSKMNLVTLHQTSSYWWHNCRVSCQNESHGDIVLALAFLD